jgi:hypothetical protein
MKKYSLYILILVNLVPVFGVLFLHWSLFSVMFFYWLESAVVGLYNIPKLFMAKATPDSGTKKAILSASQTKGRLAITGFFLFHYGMFMLGHGLFVFELFGPPDLTMPTFFIGFGALAVSHGISFVLNYIGHKEYEKVTIAQQMFAPYKRIVIMHVTIIIGGFIVSLFGAPVLALVFMILLKIAIDGASHIHEHKRLGTFLRRLPIPTEFQDSGE